MKFITLALATSACAPANSLGLRSLRNKSSYKSNDEAGAAVAIVGDDSKEDKRDLLSASDSCNPDTPVMWHPDYSMTWSTSST